MWSHAYVAIFQTQISLGSQACAGTSLGQTERPMA